MKKSISPQSLEPGNLPTYKTLSNVYSKQTLKKKSLLGSSCQSLAAKESPFSHVIGDSAFLNFQTITSIGESLKKSWIFGSKSIRQSRRDSSSLCVSLTVSKNRS
jgi:hypothetical protein